MALAVLVTGCSDEAQDNGGLGAPNATTLVARYEGEWKVGNHYAGKGEVGVYTTGFDLSTVPLSLIHISEPTRRYCVSRMPSSA